MSAISRAVLIKLYSLQSLENFLKLLLRQVKIYIDNNFNTTKVKVEDPTRDNFTQPLSIKKILEELKISKDNYYRALSISKDKDLEMPLKRNLILALLIIILILV